MENIIIQKIITKKWVIQILFILYNNQLSYRKIRTTLQIPNSTLSLRLNELVKYNYLEKFVFGSISKPHYTEYKITKLGLDYINSIMSL